MLSETEVGVAVGYNVERPVTAGLGGCISFLRIRTRPTVARDPSPEVIGGVREAYKSLLPSEGGTVRNRVLEIGTAGPVSLISNLRNQPFFRFAACGGKESVHQS